MALSASCQMIHLTFLCVIAYCLITGIISYTCVINDFEPVPARIFAQRVLEFKEHGINEEEAMQVADMEYRAEKKMKKKAYSQLKENAWLQEKRRPPKLYPSPIKEIQAKERKYVHDRFYNPSILKMVQMLKEEKAAEAQDRMRGGGW